MAAVRRRSTRLSSISKPPSEEENNCNVMNRLLGNNNNVNDSPSTGKSSRPARKSLANMRSSLSRPMPASKKRLAAQQLLELETINLISDDEEDDENEYAKTIATYDDMRDSYAGGLDVSPPKQARRNTQNATTTAQQLTPSPSQLINRLKLQDSPQGQQSSPPPKSAATTPKRKPSEAQTPTMKAPRSKYQNARRVLNSMEADQLPGRENELRELHEFFREHLDKGTSASLYVSGQPGTGKTASLSLLLHSPEFARSMQRVYINCTAIASAGSVYKTICSELGLSPTRGPGRSEKYYLAAIEEHLCSSAERTVVIMLDEIDQLCTTKQSVLYTIFAWPALVGARLLLIGVANSLDLTDRVLQRLNAHCHLKPRLMHFAPYTKQQIVEIFKSRLEQAGVLDVFPAMALQLLAAKVSAVSGDVRRALDIGRRVVELAEQQQEKADTQRRLIDVAQLETQLEGEMQQTADEEAPSAPRQETVEIKEVAAVLNTVYGATQALQEDLESAFPLQQKLVLAALMLMLRHERNKDIGLVRLHEVYQRVCRRRNINALDQTEFIGVIDLVETRGIVRVLRKKEPRFNKLQLQWDEEEVHAALQDKQLIAAIIDDKACLKSAA